jgi:hypothetical protein
MRLFQKTYKVLAKEYSDRIIDNMLEEEPSVAYSRNQFWQYVKEEYNGNQDFSWAINENYIVFDDEKDYMMFLLKM